MCNLINTHTHTHTHIRHFHSARVIISADGVVLAGTRHFRSQGPVPRHAHCTEGVTESEGREGANDIGGGSGGGIRDGNGVEGRNWDMKSDGDKDEVGTGSGVEASERTQDGNGHGSGGGTEPKTGVETRGRTKDGNGDGSGDGSGDGDGNEDGIGEGGGEVKKRKNPHTHKTKSCRYDVGNGGDLSGKIKKT